MLMLLGARLTLRYDDNLTSRLGRIGPPTRLAVMSGCLMVLVAGDGDDLQSDTLQSSWTHPGVCPPVCHPRPSTGRFPGVRMFPASMDVSISGYIAMIMSP